MSQYFEIEQGDYETLVSVIQYVIGRQGEKIDAPMVELLTQELGKVTGHIENEQSGGGDQTCVEIDTVLDFIGKKKGQEDNGRRRNNKGPGSTEGR